MRITLAGIAVFVLALAALPRLQGPPTSPAPASPAQQALPPVLRTCATCHGEHGEGRPALAAPRLAGQSAHYLLKQLESYADGTRQDPAMAPIARGLSPELRRAASEHYARAVGPVDTSASTFTAPWAERGAVVATQGDAIHSVQACDNCHGPGGIGQPPAIPYLAGLDDGYIRASLNAWREGRRRNDAGQQMAVVAKALSPGDIAAVARYYAGAPPPRPAPANVVTAGRPQLLPPAMTRVMVEGTTVSGTAGSEGRGPMAGGTQGLAQAGEADGSGAAGRAASGGAAMRAAAAGAATRRGDPARGRALLEAGTYGCTACHAVPGIRSPRGIVGPALDGLAGRPLLAGQLRNTPDVLVAFLRDPPSLVPATGMPNVGLSAEDARHIAAYLHTRARERDR